jgi:hypothetical protein
MKPIIKYTLIAVLVLAVAGATVAGVAYAQDGDHPMRGKGGLAELLGITQEELHDLIQEGKTIEELADEAGVDLNAYKAEMMKDWEETIRTKINEALAEGTISEDQADWLLEGLDKGYLNGPFFKFGGHGKGEFGDKADFDGKPDRGMRDGWNAE